jgi:hypothetical protein
MPHNEEVRSDHSPDSPNDPRPEEALLPVFSSSNYDAEMESMTIKGILESSDIPAIIVGPHVLPNLEFQVQVPEHMLERARQTIEEARAAGSGAAAEAEAEGEAGSSGSGV